MKSVLLVFFSSLQIFISAQSEIDIFINDEMELKHISGISACVVKEGKLAWIGNYGIANRTTMDPVTPQTGFMLASISKTITCTAIMQLYEEGYFELDDDINDYLPFEVHNPNYYDSVITFRQLLSHTSSLADNWNILDTVYVYGDSPLSLEDFMVGYFAPDGNYYYADDNFYTYPPATQYNYCNEGIALCGYLVEVFTGNAFNIYCNQEIFEPLCMENTAWFLSELDSNTIAHPYIYSSGAYHDQGLYCYPDYPDGQLRTTAISLAKFLWMNINAGNFDGEQILETPTIDLIRSAVVPEIDETQGLVWYNYSDYTGTWWGHSGGDAGVSTDMYFNEATQTGVILLTNSGSNHNSIWYEIVEMAESLDLTGAPEIACVTEIPSAISQINLSPVRIYPNPSSEFISINSAFQISEYTIYNSNGIVCLQADVTPDKIDISSLPSGIYTINIQIDESGKSSCTQNLFIKL